jgi:hypothetical protein
MPENARFSANQLRFIDWLAHGKVFRSPPTQALFAKSINVNEATLTRWKKGQNGFSKDDFWNAVTARSKELMFEALPDVFAAVVSQAEMGNFQHAKLILEMAGEYQETGTEDKPYIVKVIKGVSVDDL